jgi:hypothetical protein
MSSVEQGFGLAKLRPHQLARRPGVDRQRDQILLCSIVQITLLEATFGILGRNHPLAGGTPLACLRRDLVEPWLRLDGEPNARQRGARLCGQVGQQPLLGGR